ncbi:hypothetical protein H1P_1060018 [Hyella patelloides LEGE 07179]|uniref:Uncharacterized protein n=1 Tax=Hyella patelloides LEGE 07179 TaxID=945734 RepID=A0A563VJJ4_9CYAN|nr:hypothetical protein H1P_1060018 [Hyella patelloides LEGE 07179]
MLRKSHHMKMDKKLLELKARLYYQFVWSDNSDRIVKSIIRNY